jgi:deoxyribodipyrimidine photo-lyase
MGENTSSRLSPWLAMGCISPRSVYYHIKQFEQQVAANESTYWVYFELLWRDFFRFMFKKHRQRFFWKKGIQGKTAYEIKENVQLLTDWKRGETGNELVDAAMHELNLTGFMSNRSRQLVASYFCYELQLDWRIGAAYFEQQLIDYDVSTNWGNWAYIAGAGNDPRGGRKMDFAKQAEQYDKNRQFRNLWLSQT